MQKAFAVHFWFGFVQMCTVLSCFPACYFLALVKGKRKEQIH